MALFAASLNTLKKRATNLANEVLKGDDAKKKSDAPIGPPSLDTQSAIRGFTVAADGQASGAGGVLDAPILVRYEVQNGDESERELAAFPLQASAASPTLGHIRRCFPVPGRFHFRFRTPTPDGAFGGYIWVDLANDAEPLPIIRGEVSMKALRLPDTADAQRFFESFPNSALAAAAVEATSSSAPATWGLGGGLGGLGGLGAGGGGYSSPAARSPSSTPPRSQSPEAETQGFGDPQPHGRMPSASPERRASPEPTPPPSPPPTAKLPSDLMSFGSETPGGRAGAGAGDAGLPAAVVAAAAAAAQAAAAPPAPASPPVVLDREKLKAEREAREQQRVRDAAKRQQEAQQREEQLKRDKVAEGNKVDSEMTSWAKTPDGQAYKDVKVLLSTMHTVTWSDCSWTELPLSELMSGANCVKKHYRRAILMCHPDKQKEASPEQQVRADRIFQALNEAFKISGE